MKKLFLIPFCCLIVLSFNSFAQDGGAMDAGMQAWMEYMSPGEMHKMLEKGTGTWHTKVTMWNSPDSEPIVSEGTTVNEMIMGGRYQRSTHKANMMGMDMEGMTIVGFDNATKKFNSIWIDNLGTGMMFSTGAYNEETGKVEMIGYMVDPMTGQEIAVKQNIERVDDNHHVFEMFMKDENGNEFKTMHIEYTRQ